MVPAVPGMVGLSWLLVWITAWPGFWWTGTVLAFVVIPVADQLLGQDTRNRAPDHALPALEGDRYYRAATHLYMPAQYLSLIFACWLWSGGGWLSISPAGKLGLMVTTGVVGGIANNAAHELGHKRERVERWLSKLTLAQSFYGQFYVEHNRGHHVRVATAEDPARARFRENVYAFAIGRPGNWNPKGLPAKDIHAGLRAMMSSTRGSSARHCSPGSPSGSALSTCPGWPARHWSACFCSRR